MVVDADAAAGNKRGDDDAEGRPHRSESTARDSVSASD